MSYTELAIVALLLAGALDLFIIKSRLLVKKVFWTSYAIILPFQLLTNWWLTSRNLVMYQSNTIIGVRIASAPLEDLAFGFSLILSVLSMWVFWGRRGMK